MTKPDAKANAVVKGKPAVAHAQPSKPIAKPAKKVVAKAPAKKPKKKR